MAVDRPVATSWRREVPCFRCDGVAAALVVDYESGGRGLTLTLEGFVVRKVSFLSEAAAEGIAEEEDLEILRWVPPAFHGFYCRECTAAYCRACWRVGPREYDDDGYVATFGVCP